MSWAEQTWDGLARRVMGLRLHREIGGVAFEVFHFLVTRSIRGGNLSGVLGSGEDDGILHILYDSEAIGKELHLDEELVEEAIGTLAKLGWIRIRDREEDSLLIIGHLYYHLMDKDCPVFDRIELVFDLAYPPPKDTWAEEAVERIMARKAADDRAAKEEADRCA